MTIKNTIYLVLIFISSKTINTINSATPIWSASPYFKNGTSHIIKVQLFSLIPHLHPLSKQVSKFLSNWLSYSSYHQYMLQLSHAVFTHWRKIKRKDQ